MLDFSLSPGLDLGDEANPLILYRESFAELQKSRNLRNRLSGKVTNSDA
jgi:hypothetical protein